MSNKNEIKDEDFIGGGMKANPNAKTYDEFVRSERERIFPDKVKKQNEIKEILFDAFRNEKIVTVYEYIYLMPYAVGRKVKYQEKFWVYTGYVYDCYLSDDESAMVVISNLLTKSRQTIKISNINSVKILSEKEISEIDIEPDDYPISFGKAFKCDPHFEEGFEPYHIDLNKIFIRAAVPMDYEIDKGFFAETPLDDENYDELVNTAEREEISIYDSLDYFTKVEVEDNKDMKIIFGEFDIKEVPKVMDKLAEDLGEVRHQIISLDDYTGDIEHVHYDALSKENYEYMIKAYTPYNLFESDYNLEESDDTEEE